MRSCCQGLQLASEHERTVVAKIVKRLDTEAVARQDAFAGVRINHRQCPHAVELVEGVKSPLSVRSRYHLGVARCPERVAGRFEFSAKFLEVVDLAVEDDHKAAIRTQHRLMPGWRRIDHR